jgi:hypothetical protein
MPSKIIQFSFLSFAILIFCTNQVCAQAQIELTKIQLTIPENTYESKDQIFQLEEGTKKEIVISEGGAKITIGMKITRMKSKISNHKDLGIKFQYNYRCVFGSEKRKGKSERFFWPGEETSFNEKMEFSFDRKKLKPSQVKINFNTQIKM